VAYGDLGLRVTLPSVRLSASEILDQVARQAGAEGHGLPGQVGRAPLVRRGGHERTPARPRLHQSLRYQLTDRLGDRHRGGLVPSGQLAHRWQPRAGLRGGHEPAQILDDTLGCVTVTHDGSE
jgi:hypothetical protein